MSRLEAHPTAIIDPSAQVGDGSFVGPYCIIGPHVKLGEKNHLSSHVVIEGHTEIGDENRFFQFCSVGSQPQDLKYRGEPSRLVIGNRNIIREYATLQPGTQGGGMLTQVGDDCLFMVSSHIGHDCFIGNKCIIANCAAVAGHVTMGNGVILGGLAAVHQYVRIGDLTMIGGGAMAVQDLPPFCMAQGDRATLVGVNRVGLERAGFSSSEITSVRTLYRELFVSRHEGLKERAKQLLAELAPDNRGRQFLEFIIGSARGVAPVRGAEAKA